MSASKPIRNPFPGLRSFDATEAELFFGRDAEVNELLHRLHSHRLVLVTGQAGSGRASLVRAGLLPALEAEEWQFISLRPGLHPMRSLAEAICRDIGISDPDSVEREMHANGFALSSASFRGAKPHLYIVDQFEDIFHLGARSLVTEDEIAEFLNLLANAAARKILPTYILLIVRGDFLGDCTRWVPLTDAMNGGALYWVPPIRREQLRQVITAPLRHAGAQITPSLLQHILNDAGEEPDILASLQYTLQQIWIAWCRHGDQQSPVDHRHYEEAGGIAGSLTLGADRGYHSLTPADQQLTKRIFVGLVSVQGDHLTRRPVPVGELAAITGAPLEDLGRVIEYFAAPDRAFISVGPGPLARDTIVDIGHEILLHRWLRLQLWIDEERESLRMLTRLTRLAEYDALLSAAQLQQADEWLKINQPTEPWAAKYGLLTAPVTFFVAYQKRLQSRRRRLRLALGFLAAAVFVAGLLYFVASR